MSLISPTIHIELVEVADEGVVSSGGRCILRLEVDPLVLQCLELSQIIKVSSSLPCVASKEKYAILK